MQISRRHFSEHVLTTTLLISFMRFQTNIYKCFNELQAAAAASETKTNQHFSQRGALKITILANKNKLPMINQLLLLNCVELINFSS